MAELRKVRVQLLDETTGAVVEEVDVLTSPESVLFSDGKNLTEKLNEIELAPGPQGPVGPKGDTGAAGARGATGATGPQGAKGDVGAPFQIKKLYQSVAAMNADFAGTDVKTGEFVMINTNNVADADNAKLYCKGSTAYTFITDLSGAQGIQGPTGSKGDKGDTGDIGPKGATGATGPQGAQGIQGPTGATGPKGATGPQGAPGDTVRIGTTFATATQRKLFFKVVS